MALQGRFLLRLQKALMSATSRMYEDDDDLIQMQRLLMKGRGQTNDLHYPHVGLLMWIFFMVL